MRSNMPVRTWLEESCRRVFWKEPAMHRIRGREKGSPAQPCPVLCTIQAEKAMQATMQLPSQLSITGKYRRFANSRQTLEQLQRDHREDLCKLSIITGLEERYRQDQLQPDSLGKA
ncbi:hypothetical protein B5807_02517 [Epicoccum nigrum]|uniref:Uncharacterized protein n=1 Tax=Epicoccum nigrum TaxID=105696 RepID=A0A1Y2MAI3_EPING|nr:hypothetical protein B5807_02517 [Epicoccum nigrum]